MGDAGWPWVLARTLLLGLLVPAVVWDRDGRGLHDRAAGTTLWGAPKVANYLPASLGQRAVCRIRPR